MTDNKKTKQSVATIEEVKENGKKIVNVNGQEVGIFYVDGEFYAWRNFCPHFAAPICEGKITGTRLTSDVYEYNYGKDGQIIRCPWHGWEFDLKTGEHLVDVTVKLRGVPLEIDETHIYVYSR
ncbi:Rieske (2Fe-2S) protein [Robertmurraya massiliosenegalensis]|uniref:Rieske (2Fe-2S) protein n=1 Tax=Robertmurraya TaxID=2837507 RepID=UPI0039A65506